MSRASIKANQVISTSGISFGTSGARGLVEKFSDDVCAAFTAAFIEQMRSNYNFDRIAIAIDRRPSSSQMAAACAGMARGLGLNVDYYGILPTPALALQAMADGVPAIMVTGSHIPFDRNGIKFYRPDGEITKTDEQAILNSRAVLPAYQPVRPKLSADATTRYISRYTSQYASNALAGMRIGLYEHSAAGRDINRSIFEELGATVVSLGRTDKFVPIDTEAVSEEDRVLGQKWAKEHTLDAIFSTDGDGDRPLLADENGQWLRGDILGLLCSRYLGIEALAVPVSCNTAIDLCGAFNTVTRTRIGSPYVIEAMETLSNQYPSVAGFEANGGFLLGTDIQTEKEVLKTLPTRDAILPALVALTAAQSEGKALSLMSDELPQRYTVSDRITNFSTDKSKQLIASWKTNPESLQTDLALASEIETLDYTDGLRATLKNERIVHLRPSGNAPELRCYCEAENQGTAQDLLDHCIDLISKQK